MVAETIIIAIVVAALAVLYGAALTGDYPILTNHLRGLNANRAGSRPIRILVFVIGLGAALYAALAFRGSFGALTGTFQWWIGVAVAIFAIVLVAGSLLLGGANAIGVVIALLGLLGLIVVTSIEKLSEFESISLVGPVEFSPQIALIGGFTVIVFFGAAYTFDSIPFE